jgi:hypothetical protein
MIRNNYKIAFVIAAMFAGFGAYANDVYIEQVGEDNVTTINQTGSSNTIKGVGAGSTDPALIKGNGNIVTIDQIGVSNTLNLSINDGIGLGAGTGSTVTVYTDGSGNEQTIQCGTGLTASCSASSITQTISGNNNTVSQILESTGKHITNFSITGNSNTVTHTTSGTVVANATITVNGVGGVGSGDSNIITLNQAGQGPRNAVITQSGNNSSITINQLTE